MNKKNIKILYIGAAVFFILCEILVVLLGSSYVAQDKRPKCSYTSDYVIDATIQSTGSISWYEAGGMHFVPKTGDRVKIINVNSDDTCTIVDTYNGRDASTCAFNVKLSDLSYQPSAVDSVRNQLNSSYHTSIHSGMSVTASLFVALSVIILVLFFVTNIPIVVSMLTYKEDDDQFRNGFIFNIGYLVVAVILILWAMIV